MQTNKRCCCNCNRMEEKMKKTLAVMMMACMLLTVNSVSSSAEDGIMTCGFTAETEIEELD